MRNKIEDKISDGMKHDLGMVFCDNFRCKDRGEYPRCYLDIYRQCTHYPEAKLLEHLGVDRTLKKRNI